MNILILIAVSLGAATAPAARFDLKLNQQDERRLIAIVAPETGLFSVAAGDHDLAILSGEAARAALLAFENSDEPVVDFAGASGEEAGPDRKIVIHKMDYSEDLADADESRERRVIRRARPEGEFAFNFGEAKDPAPTAAARKGARLIRILGADADAAAAFIEGLDGLDAEEKRRMKEFVGL